MSDYSILQQSMLAHASTLVPQWLPGGRRNGAEYQALNPRRQDKHIGSFSVNMVTGQWADFATGTGGGDLISLYAYLRGLRQSEAARELCASQGLEWRGCKPIGLSLRSSPAVRLHHNANAEYARRVWRQSQPTQGTVVETYLKTRGIEVFPPSLRCLPKAQHKPSGQHFPGMVAGIARWPDKQVVAVHRTFLKSDGSGKAEVKQAKMMLGSVSGGAVRLAPLGEMLVIAEGIETALSILATGDNGMGVWAVLSASNFKSLVLPPACDLHNLIIAADGDDVGIKAANAAAALWDSQGYSVKIALPPAGYDFNDVLVG